MDKAKFRISQRNRSVRPLTLLVAVTALFLFAFALDDPSSTAQTLVSESNGFRIGERLTYNVSIGRFKNAAYGELHCVSRGRLADKDAIELRAKFKTLDLASVAFYLIDENRTTFAAPSTGLPLHTTITHNTFGLPKETVQSFLVAPTTHADLVTMIYRIRQSPGAGSMTMQEGEKVYTVTFAPGLTEKQRTDAGEFETTVVSLQSEYFTEHGMTNVRVNLSTDEARVPGVIRFRTSKGIVRIGLASVQNIEPETSPQPAASPVKTPLAERTPKPAATPLPYVNDVPLPPELTFGLGERLEYRITSVGQQVATMRLEAKERKQVNGLDSLLLEATFSDIRGQSPFAAGDYIRAYVSPETLAPRQFEMKFAGTLRPYSTAATFAREGSVITVGGKPLDAPVGTHSILSLLYAARSFNLKPSRDLNNPINDTRVAVLWQSQPLIFTLRPSPGEMLTLDGRQVPAQLVSVTTKNLALDILSIKVWLGNDGSRVPLRFVIGAYQADLVSSSTGQK